MFPESSNQYLTWDSIGKHVNTVESGFLRHEWLPVEWSSLRLDKVWHESEFKFMTINQNIDWGLVNGILFSER